MNAGVRTAIDAVNRQFVEGSGSRNVEAMAAVYAEDAMILPPGTPTSKAARPFRNSGPVLLRRWG